VKALCLLLFFAPGAEEDSYKDIERAFAAGAPAPEPPAGLRAPAGSERHERARSSYNKAIADWHAKEHERRRLVVEACSRHLTDYPDGARRADVIYLRGATRFQDGEFAVARTDLEEYLKVAPEGSAAATAAKASLVESCRALGDFAAALRHGGPDPDLLEEAGEVEQAIEAARKAGQEEKAARWALIGKPFPGSIELPEGTAAALVDGGKKLSKERVTRLQERFSAESRKVAFLSATGPYPAAVYLLDAQGVVRAADPRPDTIEHRVRCLIGRG
jgi:tetratricopeptide (TPR) repeat protein